MILTDVSHDNRSYVFAPVMYISKKKIGDVFDDKSQMF